MSLSLRFASFATSLLLIAVLTVTYLFDRERIAAIDKREQEHLSHHIERVADLFTQYMKRLRRDTRFLAHTPPLLAIREILDGQSMQSSNRKELSRLYSHLAQMFHAFAQARSEYLQLQLISADDGQELVRIDHLGQKIRAMQPDVLQRNGNRYYFQDALSLKDGEVLLSRIDLDREHGQTKHTGLATISAVSPVVDQDGSVFALVVINLNMNHVFEQMKDYMPATSKLYLLNQEGYFLFHPDSTGAMGLERTGVYRLQNLFPDFTSMISNLKANQDLHFYSGSDEDTVNTIVTKRKYSLTNGNYRLITLILSEPTITTQHEIFAARKKSYLLVVILMGVTILLVMLVSRRLTRSFRDLVSVSDAITQGNYDVEVPNTPGKDLENLTRGFRHMITTVKKREQQLIELNLTLEYQVDERTRELADSRAELAREQLILQSILDHVGDGVVAIDGNGHFLLWNRRAEEMLGMGPAHLPPNEWSKHFGFRRAPDAEFIPDLELPLSRALKGEIVRNQEVFVSNSHNSPGCWISAFARPLTMLRGERDGAVAVLVDITEARNLRDQMETQSGELAKIGRLTLIGQIVDTMAHRLSQPLAAIANYAGAALQLQASNNLDGRRLNEVLELIARQADRGGECLRDLRALRMRGSLPHGKSDINAIIDSALQLLDDRLQRLNIQVEKATESELPMLYGQNVELQQVVVHLLMNAMESLATVSDHQRILRLASSFKAEKNLLCIEIGDNGPGIPANLHEQIFEAWFTTKPDSLGLGLSVAQSIVENHNGSLSIQDHGDDMTWFLIELPAID